MTGVQSRELTGSPNEPTFSVVRVSETVEHQAGPFETRAQAKRCIERHRDQDTLAKDSPGLRGSLSRAILSRARLAG